MSLQQLWMALRLFTTKEKLLDYCSKSHCIVTGMEDVYDNIKVACLLMFGAFLLILG